MQGQAQNWVVLKFGGTSVATRECWETIAKVVRNRIHNRERPLVVCSAISGVTSLLENLVEEALKQGGSAVFGELQSRHARLCRELNLDPEMGRWAQEWQGLSRLVTGVGLLEDCSPKVRAQIMAFGELMLTKIAALWMENQGIATYWFDARQALRGLAQGERSERQHYLSAVCAYDSDPSLEEALASKQQDVIITQGFIASDASNDTVLLGRGGSDTSAAYFGAKLSAKRVEIWTDVPGMFTTNPRLEPTAKLLLRLSYEEAQELAACGAKVLHPRCLDPLKAQAIPLQIRWTERPDFDGMWISADSGVSSGLVKAVVAKEGIYLISMESLGMWQQAGFLADIFSCFKKHGFSIDLIATSQKNVTVSLDGIANVLHTEALERLCLDLQQFCQPKLVGPVAVVSLVGKHVRAMMHELGRAFDVLEHRQLYMMTQSASDLNLSFALETTEANKLVQSLHLRFFADSLAKDMFGPSWQQLFSPEKPAQTAGQMHWWQKEREKLLAIAAEHTPRYVYHEPSLRAAVADILRLQAIDKLYYAMKANAHPAILKLFFELGLKFECVSMGEVEHLNRHVPGLKAEDILFTPNFAAIKEYKQALALGCRVTVDNLSLLELHPDVFYRQKLFIRFDPGIGRGHHQHVRTAGQQSKFGIAALAWERLAVLEKELELALQGFHAHVGSGIREAESWAETAKFLAELANLFPQVSILNLGGGLGVVENPQDSPLNLAALASSLACFKDRHQRWQLWLEPGRFLVANAGVLLAQVTQCKQKAERHFVGLDTGMNSLIRPALYGAYHEIVNLSRLGEALQLRADVVGPICETGDVLGRERSLPLSQEGDIFLIATAGAYGQVMASNYNQRQAADEYVLR